MSLRQARWWFVLPNIGRIETMLHRKTLEEYRRMTTSERLQWTLEMIRDSTLNHSQRTTVPYQGRHGHKPRLRLPSALRSGHRGTAE